MLELWQYYNFNLVIKKNKKNCRVELEVNLKNINNISLKDYLISYGLTLKNTPKFS